DAAGKTLFVAGPWGDSVAIVNLDNPAQPALVRFDNGTYPYTCMPEPGGKRLFVSLWSKAAVAVIELADNKVSQTWATEQHPTEMALSPDGKTLFVACANSTQVSVLDTATGKGYETIGCSLHPKAPAGNTPNSLCLTPDGAMLFVANADCHNVAVF